MEACNKTQSSLDLPAAWQHDKALDDCMIKLYENKLWTDVKFKCKDHDNYERIHAHKIVLAARSPVFQAMFFGPCTEEKEEILLDSIEAETFDLFLRYTYMDKVTLTEDLAALVLETAHYYKVTNLVQLCADFLASCVRHDNVCGILSLARRYEVSSLCKVCCIFIDENADKVIESEGFLELTEHNLTFILKGDTFYADETKIFQKAEEWAKKKILKEGQIENNWQNIRKIFGPTFYYLRLPSMSLDNFLKCTRRKGYFSMEEYEDIVDFINRTPDTAVKSNSCVARLPNEETIYCSDEQNTQVASDKIQTRFYITIHRDVKLKTVELAEILPYLKYDSILYSDKNAEFVYLNSSEATYALSKYTHQVIAPQSYQSVCKLQKQGGQDLPKGVKNVITGSLKLTCQKDENETVAVDDVDVGSEFEKIPNTYEVFQQDLRLVSMNEAERNITLEHPIILKKSRSPFILTLDLEYEYSGSVKMKTGRSSEKTFISDNGVFEVKNRHGQFRGVRSVCFENISNRDEC